MWLGFVLFFAGGLFLGTPMGEKFVPAACAFAAVFAGLGLVLHAL